MLTFFFFENTKYFNIHKGKKVLKKLKKLTKNGCGRIKTLEHGTLIFFGFLSLSLFNF